MSERIVEIQGPGAHLSLYRGFMEINRAGHPTQRVALDHIHSVIVTGPGCSHTSNLLSELAERGIPFALCGKNFQPTAYLLPVSGHYMQSARMQAQAEASQPVRKRLWKSLVKKKIAHQAHALSAIDPQTQGTLNRLVLDVRSGDTTNVESQAARLYWPALLGKGFIRNPKNLGINSLLNYGYAVIRSSVARAVTSAGLHPTLGLHHIGPRNPMCLVDDLIEPYRPLVDMVVWSMSEHEGYQEITPQVKQQLALLAVIDLPSDNGKSPLFQTATRLATSLAQVFLGERTELILPTLPEVATLTQQFGE